MKQTKLLKNVLVGALAVSMVAGGAASAFADGDKREDKDYKKGEIHIKAKGDSKLEIKLHFRDVEDQAAWAMKYIAELAAMGVFNGYEDGSFRPNQHIPRIEALTAAVRLMGLEAQAKSEAEMSTELNFRDANKIPAWSVGYVAVAAENDLFAEYDTEVRPDQKATRLWATMLLVKALKLEDEAKANMNAKLSFKDAKAIPAGAVGFVKVALDKGLITGYNDNTFQPNKPVTRAEMAALLGRTENQLPQAPGQTNAQFTGKVAQVATNAISITADGVTTAYPVDANAFVFRNNVKSSLSAVLAGDQVTVHMYNGIVNFIEVKQPVNVTTVAGTYKSHRVNAEGKLDLISIAQEVNGQNPQTVILNVAPDAAITNGTVSSFVQDQTRLELTLTNQTVTSIAIK
ncbi:S-layer homology domain-containing protein [Paenibacillus thermotolerans]|uniref:S-layer homology domain-containing protein n=1 Tax=Paenibacillus thermotolerans TaxID=3027807 RepID=UPI002367BD20|nr:MULTISPECIES: S-layer homology domain-containing protein [unclassified Paenibacillus]